MNSKCIGNMTMYTWMCFVLKMNFLECLLSVLHTFL